jgi:hypothetical protein
MTIEQTSNEWLVVVTYTELVRINIHVPILLLQRAFICEHLCACMCLCECVSVCVCACTRAAANNAHVMLMFSVHMSLGGTPLHLHPWT